MSETLTAGMAYRCALALDELALRLDPLTDRYAEHEVPDELVAGVRTIADQITRINVGLRERDWGDGFTDGKTLSRARGLGLG